MAEQTEATVRGVRCQTCNSDTNGCGVVTSKAPDGTCTRWVCRATNADLFAGLNALLIECGRQESLIYSGKGVPANEALPFLVRVARLAEGLCGVLSLDTYDDVIDALEDAV